MPATKNCASGSWVPSNPEMMNSNKVRSKRSISLDQNTSHESGMKLPFQFTTLVNPHCLAFLDRRFCPWAVYLALGSIWSNRIPLSHASLLRGPCGFLNMCGVRRDAIYTARHTSDLFSGCVDKHYSSVYPWYFYQALTFDPKSKFHHLLSIRHCKVVLFPLRKGKDSGTGQLVLSCVALVSNSFLLLLVRHL